MRSVKRSASAEAGAGAPFKGTPNVPDYVRGNGMRGAWQKGYNASMAGEHIDANPYRYGDEGEAVTYERGMHGMWREGWSAAEHAPGRDE
jgi:hypothetical protein